MSHVMVDIESFGTRPGSVIVSIGAVAFNADGMGQTFYRVIDVASSLLAGLTIDSRTIGWWREQSSDARGALLVNGKVNLAAALTEFAILVNGQTHLWAKGPDFDLVLLDAAYQSLGIKVPWSYRNARDVRTVLALSGVKQTENTDKHNALSDAINQANAVILAYKVLGREMGS